MSKLREFIEDDSASVAIEYAIVASCIALTIVSSLGQFGLSLRRIYRMMAVAFNGEPM